MNFGGNFLTHLKKGLIDWLTGSLQGVYIPKALTLVEFGKLALSVLGITWAQIRGKIVKALGPNGELIMKGLETAFDIIVALATGGPAAAWEVIKDKLNDLKDQIVSGITSFVVETVVQKAIPKLIAMFIPGAGFISAIISIYDTVMVFVNKISKIIQVVTAFINSIVAIAQGNIGAAAGKVESILGGLLSIAISFLAGFVGLGKVTDKIMKVVNQVRAKVDKAIDTAIAFIINKAKALFAKLFGKKKDDKKDDPNDVKTKVKNELAGRLAGAVEPNAAPAIIKDVRSKYQKDGLKSLKAIEKKAGEFDMDAVASPGSKVGHFTVRDFEIKRPRTGLIATLGGTTLGRWRNEGGKHAEAHFLAELPGLLPALTPEEQKAGTKKKVDVNISLTRSPCGNCAGLIAGFKSKVPNHDVTFNISMMTLYKGGAEGSVQALELLHKEGHKLSVATIDQILANKMFKDDEVPDELKKDIDGKTAKLEAAIKKIQEA
jgi:hypothetical protein